MSFNRTKKHNIVHFKSDRPANLVGEREFPRASGVGAPPKITPHVKVDGVILV